MISKMEKEDKHSPSEFYYPDQEKTAKIIVSSSYAETETGGAFYYQKLSAV